MLKQACPCSTTLAEAYQPWAKVQEESVDGVEADTALERDTFHMRDGFTRVATDQLNVYQKQITQGQKTRMFNDPAQD